MPKTLPSRKATAMEMPKSESTQCPLCVEEMDMTDLSFLPCPCGYRVCLFCLQQIKLHCRNQCPGCRREYGTVPLEAGPAASSASANTQEPHLASLSSSASSHHNQQEASSAFHHPNSHGNNNAHSSSHTSSHHHSNHHHHSNNHNTYASSGPPRPPSGLHSTLARGGSGGGGAVHPPKPPPASASMHERLKRAAEHSSAARREEAASSGSSVGLPSGATWATQAISKQQHQQHLQQQEAERQARQQPAPVVADETAWPSLADTMQPPAPAASAASSAVQQKEQQAAQKQAAQKQQMQQMQQLRQSLQQQQQRQREAQAQREREREREQREQQAQREREREREQEQQQQQQQEQQQLSQRPSLTANNNSMDRVASSSSIEHMSQDPVVPPEQLGLQHGRRPQPPFAPPAAAPSPAPLSMDPQASHTAHFTTHVQGLSRNVSVPLPASAAVEPYPEAMPLLASLSSGVKAGGINSKDAAAQLVSLLKHKEAQQGRMQSLLAAGRVPPGFAVPQQQQQQQQQQPQTTGVAAPAPPAPPAAPPNSNGCLTPMDSPVIPTPSIGRYQPIGKPIGPTPQQQQQQQQQPPPPQSNGNSLHPLHSTHPPYANGTGLGTYSMWSGLPGIDLTPTYSPLGSSMWSGLGSCAPPGVDPAAPVSSAFAQPQAPTTAAPTLSSRPPPPGFGGPSYTPGLLDASAAAAKAGAAAGYRPLGVLPGETRYNPLNPLNFQSTFGTNASPTSVSQFSAYRPQLL